MFVIFHSQCGEAAEVPQNAHILGNSWYCNDGYSRVGNVCQKLIVPINAHVLGNSWYCNDGYSRNGDSCQKLLVPANAHILGNSWYCNDGYSKSGSDCHKLIVPTNAYVLGNSWYCNDGFSKVGNNCQKLIVPENAHALGNSWYCNDGFKQAGNSCLIMTTNEKRELERFIQERRAESTDGTTVFVTKIDSDDDDILKLENGGIIEISRGNLGYVGYRKDAYLYLKRGNCQIAIEGKRTFQCEVIKEPNGPGKPAKQLQVSDVKGNGSILKMMNGEIYEVSSMDQITSSMWLGFFDALLVDGDQLINLNSGESVNVEKVR